MTDEHYYFRIAKYSLWNTIGILASVIRSVFVSFFIAYLVSPFEYGVYNYMLALSSLYVVIAGFGTIPLIPKFIAEEKDTKSKYKILCILITSISKRSIFLSLIYFIFIYFAADNGILIKEIIDAYPILFFIHIILFTLAIFQSALYGFFYFKDFNISLVLSNLMFILSLLLLVLTKSEINYVLLLLITVSSYLIQILYIVLRNWTIIRELFSKCISLFNQIDRYETLVKKAKKLSLAVYTNQVADQIVWQKSELFFLGYYGYSASLGLYSFAYNIAGFSFSFIPRIFSGFFMPLFSELKLKEKHSIISTIFEDFTKGIIGLSAVIGVFMILIFKFIFLVSFPLYSESLLIIPIILYGFIINSAGVLGSALFHAYDLSWKATKITTLGALLNIFLDVLLIPKYAHIGAALANTISQVFIMVLATYVLIKKINIHYPIKSVIIYSVTYVIYSYTIVLLVDIYTLNVYIFLTIAIILLIFILFVYFDNSTFIKNFVRGLIGGAASK